MHEIEISGWCAPDERNAAETSAAGTPTGVLRTTRGDLAGRVPLSLSVSPAAGLLGRLAFRARSISGGSAATDRLSRNGQLSAGREAGWVP
jgi:hypothetical protein